MFMWKSTVKYQFPYEFMPIVLYRCSLYRKILYNDTRIKPKVLFPDSYVFHGKYLHVKAGKNDADPLNKGEDVLICPRNIIKVTLQREEEKTERQVHVHILCSSRLLKILQSRSFQVGHNYIAKCLLEKQWWVIIWKLKIKSKRKNHKSYDNMLLNNLFGAAMDSLLLKFFKSGLEGFQEEIISLNPKLWALLTEFRVRVSDLHYASSQVK